MNKQLAGIILMLFVGTFSWGQGKKETFDTKKMKEEQEIMRRILITKLTDFAQSPAFFSNVNSFYLVEQGIVLTINTGGFRNMPSHPAASKALNSIMESTKKLADELVTQTLELDRAKAQLSRNALPQALQKSGAAPPTSPALPDPALAERISAFQKTIEELREKIRVSIQESDKINAQNFEKTLGELRSVLIEILANYGDSLTIVKPAEYISFVLRTDALFRTTSGLEIISARKSWITDYKAGRLTLEAFKQKVIQCSE
jgi:hypothetical protein